MVDRRIWQRWIIAVRAAGVPRAAAVLPMTLLLTSCTHDPPVRPVSLVLLAVAVVLGAPAVSFPLKRRDSDWVFASFAIQVAGYLWYEAGISSNIDNRADLVFMYPAIAVNAWIAFGNLGSPPGPPESADSIPGVSTPVDQVDDDERA